MKQQQDLLAMMYTDASLRERFRERPEEVAKDFGLSPEEAADLRSVAVEEVDRFADSLHRKRLREVEKLIPTAASMLGDDLSRLFREFAAGFSPVSTKKHLEDALAFARWLLRGNRLQQPTADVVKFDAARLRHGSGDRRITFCTLGHDVRPVFDRGGHASEADIRPRRSLAVWVTIGPRTRFIFI